MNNAATARMPFVLSMVIFGTIGIFVRYIPLTSAAIAFVRGILGALFLLLTVALRGRKLQLQAIRANLVMLLVSGGFIGFNWILLFEAYRYTTVATATLCYYLAPIIVIAASPFVFGEKITAKKALCVVAALAGMVCVSGAIGSGVPRGGEMKGIVMGLGAAVLYGSIIMMNKRIHNIDAADKTIVQLATAATVVFPYTLFTNGFAAESVSPLAIVLLLVVGIFHTGLTYWLYFGSIEHIPAQTAAILSYIDPVVAVILSAVLLKEPMGLWNIVGAVLIIGAALVSELSPKKKA